MANKRIKDLSTTAAVTASDDFIAVDGATNGTRKLDAYSPTFGGNLTVNGTGTIGATTLVDASGQATSQFRVKSTANGGMFSVDAYATNNVFAGFDSDFVSPGHVARDTTAALVYKQSGRLSIFGNSGLTSGSTYTPTERVRVDLATGDMSLLSGNLTVSGTGTTALGGAGSIISLSSSGRLQLGFTYSRVADPDGAGGWLGGYNIKFSTSPKYDATGATAGLYYSSNGVRIYSGGTAVADTAAPLVATFATNGNLLLGTTTDSGNGKLQLATHTTSAGGIGFGTDWTLSRDDATNFALYATGGASATFALYLAGVKRSSIGTDGTTTYIGSRGVGYSTILMSGNGTTALTLDSSQNATFAGDRVINRKDQNAVTRLQVRNDTSGTSGQAQIAATVGDFTTYTALGQLSAGFTSTGLYQANSGYLVGSNALYIFTASGSSLVLGTNSTTALTLDSSQNATFAGNVTASKGGTAFYSIESTVNGSLSEIIIKGKNSTGTAREARLGLNKYADDVFSIYDGTTERFRLGLTNGDATFAGTVIANKATTAFRIPTAETPASASATGTVGTITWDASYIYVCTAANTWKRVAIATWP